VMEFMKTNLNYYIKFKPVLDNLIPLPRWNRPDEHGYYKLQMWEFMEMYGRHMGLGMKTPVETEVFVQVGK
jgi:hypothetical protein